MAEHSLVLMQNHTSTQKRPLRSDFLSCLNLKRVVVADHIFAGHLQLRTTTHL